MRIGRLKCMDEACGLHGVACFPCALGECGMGMRLGMGKVKECWLDDTIDIIVSY